MPLTHFRCASRLESGASVALIAPAGPLQKPEELPRAQENTRTLGWEPIVGAHASDRFGYLAGTDRDRLNDLNGALRDPKIDAIWCLRGGYGMTRLLDKVDYQALSKSPKAIIGYSDVTALHAAVQRRCNLITYHGPTAREPLWRVEAWLVRTKEILVLKAVADPVVVVVDLAAAAAKVVVARAVVEVLAVAAAEVAVPAVVDPPEVAVVEWEEADKAAAVAVVTAAADPAADRAVADKVVEVEIAAVAAVDPQVVAGEAAADREAAAVAALVVDPAAAVPPVAEVLPVVVVEWVVEVHPEAAVVAARVAEAAEAANSSRSNGASRKARRPVLFIDALSGGGSLFSSLDRPAGRYVVSPEKLAITRR